MTPSGQAICLCMIVKNESHVIRRCLASARPLLDHWIVVDTGSSDGTQDIVREAMAGLPGEVVERPWVDFAHNRSEALALARPHGDYSLIIDADDELVLAPDYRLPALGADSYTIDIHYGATTYRRPQLVRNALAWRYRGVLHEFLECAEATTQEHLDIVMKINHEGRRSTDPTTYAKDAAILAQALETETDAFLVARYTFYLAQSYRDCGEREKALALYMRRADLGFWIEEVYVSLLQAGRLMVSLDRPPDEIIATCARASRTCPSRAEAAYEASRFCRLRGRFAEGFEIAERAIELPVPAGGLFVEDWIYQYGLRDEYAVNAFWSNHFRESAAAAVQALDSGKVPPEQQPRFIKNIRFALDRIPSQASRSLHAEASPKRSLPHIHICHVSINQHEHIFAPIINVLQNALEDIGYSVSFAKNAVDHDALNIVVGHIIFAAQYEQLEYLTGSTYAVYQLEQLSDVGGLLASHPHYMKILEGCVRILEYSPSGMVYLEKEGLESKVSFLPPLYHRSMETLEPADVQDIDVLFYGSGTERRLRILDELRNAGVTTKNVFGIYGDELNALIRRAKIVLNVHAWDEINVLETVRLSFLIASRCFIVSESGDHDPYGGTVIYAKYEDLVETCVSYLQKDRSVRDDIARAAYANFLARDFASNLRTALRSIEVDTSPTVYATHSRSGGSMYSKTYEADRYHTGVDYLHFMRILGQRLKPRSYVEIGTAQGESVCQLDCDALCIDPSFEVAQNAIRQRKKIFFFQMTSDEFFADYRIDAFFPRGPDLVYLDGLHHFEATLRDFINVERSAHRRSIVIIHDCLPISLAMTSRQQTNGMWTGDVWRLLPAFKKYRPDLRIVTFDCPPTGLVVCTNLNPESTILSDNYYKIVDEFSAIILDNQKQNDVGRLYPYLDSRNILENPQDITNILA